MSPRISVARIFSRLNIGGPSIHVILVSATLDPSRFQSTLIVGQEGPTEGNMFELAARYGVRPVRIPSLGREISVWNDLWTTMALWRWMRKARPHVVHTHTSKAGFSGRLAARLAGVPVIVHTFHGHVFDGYFGPVLTRMFILLERLLGRLSDAIITISGRLKDELVRRKIAPADKICVIELGLDLDDANLVRGRYLSPYQFVFQPPGDRNDRVAQPPQQAFEEDEHSRQDRPEVSVKHVPMKSVHDHGHAGQSRREASGKPGFGCVRVDHVRASLSHPAPQRHRRPEVVPHRDFPSQGRDSYGSHSVTRRKLEHVTLGWPFLAHDQRRLESRWIESRRDQDDVDRGSPDVEAGEDAGHAYSRRHSSSWCGHR